MSPDLNPESLDKESILAFLEERAAEETTPDISVVADDAVNRELLLRFLERTSKSNGDTSEVPSEHNVPLMFAEWYKSREDDATTHTADSDETTKPKSPRNGLVDKPSKARRSLS